MKKIAGIILVLTLVWSCKKEEELLPGWFITDQVGMANMVSENGIDYQNQLYFDLGTGQLKAQNKRDAWDLALGCDPDHPNLMVNSAMLQAVAATGDTDFSRNYDPSVHSFRYESAETFFNRGIMQTDFGSDGTPAGEVFLIDLGRDLNNQRRGHKKLQILQFDKGTYRVKIANPDGSDTQEFEVDTDAGYNLQFVSFNDINTVLTLEPLKDEWDLHFTKYMEKLWDGEDTLDYSVTGCLINPYGCSAYYAEDLSLDSTISYSDITANDIIPSLFNTSANSIGFDWKFYDLDAGAFAVLNRNIYFVRDTENQVYRLRFVGFYDASGNKGAVSFEYLPL